MAYAERTAVAFDKTVADIMTLARKHGALQVGQMEEPGRLTVMFSLADRQVRFRVGWENNEASKRQRGRALYLVIKAKFESVQSGVETFEQAFLANVVLSDGRTVHERVSGNLALEYTQAKPTMYLLSSGAPE